MGAQVPLDPRLHHFQEPDHHPNRIWRGSLVRWCSYTHGPLLFRIDGAEFRYRGLGGHSARFVEHGSRC
jgi:hypothetical protein